MANLAYTALERLRPRAVVDRFEYLVEHTRGQVVLDLGAYDETAVYKRGTGTWLHEVLAQSAAEVIGVDNSPALPAEGLVTGTNSKIVRGDIFQLGALGDLERASVVVAGEIIEHLQDALSFLRALKAEPRLAGKRLLATTPNATSSYNFGLALINRESTHCDHLQVFSYKTLNTMCERARLSSWELVPYHVTFGEMRLTGTKLTRPAAAIAEPIVRMFESMFPLAAGGYIVDATI